MSVQLKAASARDLKTIYTGKGSGGNDVALVSSIPARDALDVSSTECMPQITLTFAEPIQLVQGKHYETKMSDSPEAIVYDISAKKAAAPATTHTLSVNRQAYAPNKICTFTLKADAAIKEDGSPAFSTDMVISFITATADQYNIESGYNYTVYDAHTAEEIAAMTDITPNQIFGVFAAPISEADSTTTVVCGAWFAAEFTDTDNDYANSRYSVITMQMSFASSIDNESINARVTEFLDELKNTWYYVGINERRSATSPHRTLPAAINVSSIDTTTYSTKNIINLYYSPPTGGMSKKYSGPIRMYPLTAQNW